MARRHRVVILGGGFGGLYAARSLARTDCEVTLVDRRNFHLFQPLLYQVATGGLSPGDISAPLRAVLRKQRNTRVLLGEAVDIDANQQTLTLADGETIPYDTLVVAAGARNHYFGNPHWSDHAPGLKSIEDATEMRKRILYAFEAAERETNPAARRAWLTLIVVGGGPTGVELAGALGEIANDTLKGDFRSIRSEEASIILLEHAPRLLPGYPEDLSRKAEQSLIRLCVRTRTGIKVTGIDEHGVSVTGPAGEQRIEARTVLWAAGVGASRFGQVIARRTGCELDRGGRVVVDRNLRVPRYPNIFVIGDLAHAEDAMGRLAPGIAPAAMQAGRYVGRTIRARIAGKAVPEFRYIDKGSLATIGRAAAVAEIGGFHFSGWFAWLVWLFVHLMYLVGFQNRVLVFIQWSFYYLTYHRGARLIAPDRKLDEERVPDSDGSPDHTASARD